MFFLLLLWLTYQTIQIDIDMKSPNIIIPEYGAQDQGGHLLVVDLGSLRVNSDLQGNLPEGVTINPGVRSSFSEV